MKEFKEKETSRAPKEANPIWGFEAPKYDERSSCYVSAGSDHGVGKRQPVGKSK